MFAVTDTADVTTSKSADMAVPELRQNLILPTLLAPEALPATVLPSRSARERRHAKYARRLIFSDGGVIICLSIFSAQILRFWDQPVPVSSPWAWSAGFGYTLVSCYWQCCGWDSSPWGGADQPRWPAEARGIRGAGCRHAAALRTGCDRVDAPSRRRVSRLPGDRPSPRPHRIGGEPLGGLASLHRSYPPPRHGSRPTADRRYRRFSTRCRHRIRQGSMGGLPDRGGDLHA